LASSKRRGKKRLWQKILFVPIFFVIGELVGIFGLVMWLQNFDMHLTFAWPRTLDELMPFAALVWSLIFIPICIVELGIRLIDWYFSS